MNNLNEREGEREKKQKNPKTLKGLLRIIESWLKQNKVFNNYINRALLDSKKNHRSTHIRDGNDLRSCNLFFSYCRLLYFASQFVLLIWLTKSDNMNRHRVKRPSLSAVSDTPGLSLTKVGSGTSSHKLSANHSLAAEKSER